jgi:hypothetical protein
VLFRYASTKQSTPFRQLSRALGQQGKIMVQLDYNGIALLTYLVGKLDNVIAGKLSTYVGYKQTHDEMGLALEGSTYGESLKHQGLSNLADWTESTKKPAITGLIIDVTSLMPGEGYFLLFQKTNEDFLWWEEQIKLSKATDWSSYIAEVEIPDTPVAEDTEPASPDRVKTTTYRILRDSNLAKNAKYINNYECQICGHSIQLSNDRKYAEAHHIQPLGSPHNGPDVLGNIICVCPNHHAELDYGARELDVSEIKAVDGHVIESEYVEYHNSTIYSKP